MIMPQTRLKVADNTGARELMTIRTVAGGSEFEAAIASALGGHVAEELIFGGNLARILKMD